MAKYISPNSREGITAYDPILGQNFYVEGTSDTGAINVNASFSASSISISDGANSGIKATVFDLVNSNPVATQIVDANGDAVTSFGSGDVNVLSVIPGVGATNLGKAEDALHLTGDTGVMSLAVRRDSDIQATTSGSDGDYVPLLTDFGGALKVQPNRLHIIDLFDSTSGWTVLNNDAGNLTTSNDHVSSPVSLSFDKLNGTANTVYAVIQKTIPSTNLFGLISPAVIFQSSVKIPDLTNVVNVIIRLGTDSSNYNEWAIDATSVTADQWTTVRASVVEPTGFAGSGWNAYAVTYIAVGLQFNLQTDTLAGIKFDSLSAVGANMTTAVLVTETTVSSANINMAQVGGSTTNTSFGNALNGTQRVVLANNDPAVVSLGVLDDWDESDRAKINPIVGQAGVQGASGAVSANTQRVVLATDVALPAGTNTIGKLAANSGIDIGDVDVTSIVPGTGATNLGKAKGSLVGVADTGVAVLAKMDSDVSQTAVDEGDYETGSVTMWKELRVRDQRSRDLCSCNTTSGVTVLGNDTTNLAVTTDHVFGTGALSFDKVNGAANTVFAGVSTPLSNLNISELFEDGGFLALSAKLTSLSNVVGVFVRVGTDASNYNEWEWPTSQLTVSVWNALRQPTNLPAAVVGNGWNTNNLQYIAFGVEFSSETNTLTGIKFDNVHLVQGRVTDTSIDTVISSSTNTPNINLNRVGGTSTDTNAGNKSAGTLRVTLATDDTNAVTIASGIAIMDDWDDGADRARVVGAVAEDVALAGNPIREGIRASAAEPTAMSADGDIVTPWGDRRGRQIVVQKAATATLSNVSSSASNVTVLAANSSRLGATVYNDSTQILYLKFGATASVTSFTVPLATNTYYEVPFGYTGILDGIWASANGSARVTEVA